MRVVAEGVLLNERRDDIFLNHGGEDLTVELDVECARSSRSPLRVAVLSEGGSVVSAVHTVSPGQTSFFRLSVPSQGGALRVEATPQGDAATAPVSGRYRVSLGDG